MSTFSIVEENLETLTCKNYMLGNTVYVHNSYVKHLDTIDTMYGDEPLVLVVKYKISEQCQQSNLIFLAATHDNKKVAVNLKNYTQRLCTSLGSRSGPGSHSLAFNSLALNSAPNFSLGDTSNSDPGTNVYPTTCKSTHPNPHGTKIVAVYRILNKSSVQSMIQLVQKACENGLTINRFIIAFFSTNMVYTKGDHKLTSSPTPGWALSDFATAAEFDEGVLDPLWYGAGNNLDSNEDRAFYFLKTWIMLMHKVNVDVFLSIGGWDYNCFPYAYMRYSIGSYLTSPNYYKITENSTTGDDAGCIAGNQYCYVCEPKRANETLDNYMLFPEPSWNSTWQMAQKFVEAAVTDAIPTYPKEMIIPPVWHPEINAGLSWYDHQAKKNVTVPGDSEYVTRQTNPYNAIVFLAIDLGARGIDLDYEEMWHADTFKTADQTLPNPPDMQNGPWELYHTAYKYAAIAKNILITIDEQEPSLLLSTAASAAGAWTGSWWGGNLKGLMIHINKIFPSLMKRLIAGGINVMSYDVSDDDSIHECPAEGVCTLSDQVHFYMNTYSTLNVKALTGFELGVPAYPDISHNKEHQLPLTTEQTSKIITQIDKQQSPGAFYWQWGKDATSIYTGAVKESDLNVSLCTKYLEDGKSCGGRISPGDISIK